MIKKGKINETLGKIRLNRNIPRNTLRPRNLYLLNPYAASTAITTDNTVELNEIITVFLKYWIIAGF